MKVRIKQGEEMIDATIEMIDGVMVVSPKEVKWKPEVGETFYRIGLVEQKFITTEHKWREIAYEEVYKHEWIFRTKEECDKYVERMNDVFKDER